MAITRGQMNRQLYALGELVRQPGGGNPRIKHTGQLGGIQLPGRRPMPLLPTNNGIMPRLDELGENVSSAEETLADINTRLESAESSLGGRSNQLAIQTPPNMIKPQLLGGAVGDPRMGAQFVPGNELQMIMRGAKADGGIMEVAPRQNALFGGIKKAIKGVTKGIGSILKSKLGKAALLGVGAFGLPGGLGGFKGLMGGKLPGLGIKELLTKKAADITIGDRLKVGAMGTVLGGVLGALSPEEEQEIGSGRNLDALRSKLTQAYQNLGYPEGEIPGLVENDMSEYSSGSGGYSSGGRVGFKSGTPRKKFDSLKDLEEFIIKMPYKIKYDEDGNRIDLEIPREKGPAKFDPDRKIPRRLLRNKSAVGGRIGYAEGDLSKDKFYQKWVERYKQNPDSPLVTMHENYNKYKDFYERTKKAGGGDVVDQASGIMGLPKRTNAAGVKELDLRKTGGFIPPVGVKEKADDIPAMLSNNEFVFTADAVRGMGDGNVNLGAQRMYDMMKKLENGGRV